jgi:hypothetical protein
MILIKVKEHEELSRSISSDFRINFLSKKDFRILNQDKSTPKISDKTFLRLLKNLKEKYKTPENPINQTVCSSKPANPARKRMKIITRLIKSKINAGAMSNLFLINIYAPQ